MKKFDLKTTSFLKINKLLQLTVMLPKRNQLTSDFANFIRFLKNTYIATHRNIIIYRYITFCIKKFDRFLQPYLPGKRFVAMAMLVAMILNLVLPLIDIALTNVRYTLLADYNSIRDSKSAKYQYEASNQDLKAFFGDKKYPKAHRFAFEKSGALFDLRLVEGFNRCPVNQDKCNEVAQKPNTNTPVIDFASLQQLSQVAHLAYDLEQDLKELQQSSANSTEESDANTIRDAQLILGQGATADRVEFLRSKLDQNAQDIQINYRIIHQGVQQTIILNDSSLPIQQFLLTLEDFQVVKVGHNQFALINPERTAIIQVSSPIILDGKGQKGEGLINIFQDTRGIIFEIGVDKNWFADQSRSYPVTIDTNFILSDASSSMIKAIDSTLANIQPSKTQSLKIKAGVTSDYLYEHSNSDFHVGFGSREKGKSKLAFSTQKCTASTTLSQEPEVRTSSSYSLSEPEASRSATSCGYVGIEMQLLDEQKDVAVVQNTKLTSEKKLQSDLAALTGHPELDSGSILSEARTGALDSGSGAGMTGDIQSLVDTIQAKEVKPAVDIEYKVFAQGVKEDIVLKERRDNQHSHSYALTTVGVKPIQDKVSGIWYFVSSDTASSLNTKYKLQDTSLFHIPEPFAEDISGIRTSNVDITISPWNECNKHLKSTKSDQSNCYKINISVDQQWLEDDARVYPIYIDPSIVDDTTSEFSINDTAQSASMNRVIDTNASTVTKTTYTTGTTGTTFTVPAGVTKITVKTWGAGGGGGDGVGGNSGGSGGGGGGFSKADLTVTPAEGLTVRVGGAGLAASGTAGGGGGGGYSGVFRSSTPLIIAGGGGGGTDCSSGTVGGGGGGTTGQTEQSGSSFATGGTQSAGGAASGTNPGSAGSSLTGGNAYQGSPNTGGAGGVNGGGTGGGQAATFSGGGGGGGGYFGGAGGNGGNGGCPVGGGGGGSGYVSGSNTQTIQATTGTAANVADPDYSGTAGNGGAASANGNTGRVVISYVTTDTSPVIETNYQELPADINTVGLFHMNEGAANSCTGGVKDICNAGSIGSTADGTFNGDAAFTASSKLGASALTLDGTGDYVGTSDFGDGTTTFTVEAWIKTNATGQTQIVSKDNAAGGAAQRSYQFFLDTGPKISLYVHDGVSAASQAIGATTLATGTWYHVAGVFEGGKYVKVFVNGVEDGVVTASIVSAMSNSATAVDIGRLNNATPQYFNGQIDEVRISTVARAPEEIKLSAQRRPYATYTSTVFDLTAQMSSFGNLTWTESGVSTGNGETLSSATSLIAQWNFNDDPGGVSDTTANVDAGSCGATCNGTLTSFASTSNRDEAAMTGWTANNRRWGAGAIMTDNTNDVITITDPASNQLDPGSSDMTIEMWVNTTDSNSNLFENNAANGGACTNNGFLLGIETSGIPAFWLDSNGATAGCDVRISSAENTARAKINDGNWHFIAVSVTRGTSAIMYLDGVEIGRDSTVTSYTSVTVTGNPTIGGVGMSGVFDSTRFYTRALSANEILSNYNHTNIEFQTRTGADNSPNDGSWEAWKPTTGETAVDSMDTGTGWNSTNPNTANLDTVDYGDGADGAITVSVDKDINADDMIASRNCPDGGDAVNYSVTANTSKGATSITLSSTPSSGCFAVGDEILIINLQGTNTNYSYVGSWETHTISAISTATLYFNDYGLKYPYDGSTQKVMVQRVPNYTNVTIDSTKTLSATAWNGTKNGVLFFRANGTVTVTGNISVNSDGYRGGCGASSDCNGNGDAKNGESTSGVQAVTPVIKEEGGGGGGNGGGANTGGGGGGSYGTSGTEGDDELGTGGGDSGHIYGRAGLERLLFGSAGGGGGGVCASCALDAGGDGGQAGGIAFIAANTLTVAGGINSNGANGGNGPTEGGGGGGAGGSIYIAGVSVTLGSSLVTATGGAGGDGDVANNDGGAGGSGRVAVYYTSSLSGTANPEAFTKQINFKQEGNSALKTNLGVPQPDSATVGLWHLDETNSAGPIYDATGYRTFATDTTGNLESNLISYWKLDEANNNTCVGAVNDACDAVSKYDGTAAGTAPVVAGKLGNSRDFNGTDGSVSVGDVGDNVSGLTISAWINPDNVTTDRTMIAKDSGSAGGRSWQFSMNTTGKINFHLCGDTSCSTSASPVSTTSLSTGTWYHIAAVFTGGSSAKVYLNGSQNGSTVSTAIATVPNTTTSTFIGRFSGTPTQFFDGEIDEVGVWYRALSDSEITDLYNSGNANALTSVASNNGAQVVSQTSANGFYNKAWDFNGSTNHIRVPDSGALDITGDITISAWIKPDTLPDEANIVIKRVGADCGNYHFGIKTNKLTFLTANDCTFTGNVSSASIATGVWSHVAVSLSGTSASLYINGSLDSTITSAAGTANTEDLLIGGQTNNQTTDAFDGIIDEVKISNVARSYEEIQEEFRAGRDHRIGKAITSTDFSGKSTLPFYVAADRPGTYLEATVGESAYANYEPDENTKLLMHLEEGAGTGSYFKDSSGAGNHGSIGDTPTFVQGKIGKARKFDGGNDYISIADSTSLDAAASFTVDAWINPTSFATANPMILSKWNSANADREWQLHLNTSTQVVFHVYRDNAANNYCSATGDFTFSANTWYHVAGVISGGTCYVYVNGQLVTSQAGTGSPYTGGTAPLRIASRAFGDASTWFAGTIDEARVSAAAYSADQIRQTFEVGKRTHPVTIDFVSAPQAAYTSGTSITVNNMSGQTNLSDSLKVGDTIIVQENIGGTEYRSTGTVTTIANTSTVYGTVTLASALTGLPASGYTTAAKVFKWQREYFNLSGITLRGTHDNTVTRITLRATDGSQGANIWLDDIKSNSNYLTTSTGSTVNSTVNRYYQYKAIFTSSDPALSSQLSAVTQNYSTGPNISQIMRHGFWFSSGTPQPFYWAR